MLYIIDTVIGKVTPSVSATAAFSDAQLNSSQVKRFETQFT